LKKKKNFRDYKSNNQKHAQHLEGAGPRGPTKQLGLGLSSKEKGMRKEERPSEEQQAPSEQTCQLKFAENRKKRRGPSRCSSSAHSQGERGPLLGTEFVGGLRESNARAGIPFSRGQKRGTEPGKFRSIIGKEKDRSKKKGP